MTTSLTIPIAAEIARQRLGLTPSDIPQIEVLVPDALKRVGRALKESSDNLFLKSEVDKTPTSGVIDLSNAAFVNVFIDTYRTEGAIRTQDDSDTVFFHVPSINALRASFPVDTGCVWYHLQDLKRLVFRHPVSGALDSYATPLTLVGSRIPTFSDLPAELDDQLIDRVEELFKMVGGSNFLKLDPEQARQAVKALGAGQG